jgi:hypothetical protein
MSDLDRIVQQVAHTAPVILVYEDQTPVPPSKWPRSLEPFEDGPWKDPLVAETRAHEVNWALSLGQNPASFEDFARQSAILMREGIGEQFEGLAGGPMGAFVFRGDGDQVQVQEVDPAEVAAIAQKAMRIANGDEPQPDLDEFTKRGLPTVLDLGDA